MGVAIDTIAGAATNPSATITAITMNSGDSSTVRAGDPAGMITLDNIFRQGVTEGVVRARSPRMHDPTRGIMFTPSETPAARLLLRQISQRLYPQDTLTLEVSGGSAEVDGAAFGLYYSNLPGSAARLHSLGDISGLIVYVKPVEVDVTSSGTAVNWVDTAINATEDLLRANTDYAVLGFVTDVACLAIGVKGPDTGNYRICGPGITRSDVTSDWFVAMSVQTGRPYIPVINSANKASTYLSLATVATTTAVKGQLVLAQLSQNLPN